jgi:tetratricopeptide (TPR) repeat protein
VPPATSKSRIAAAPAAGPFSSPEKRTVILSLALILATLALYNPASRHPFVNFDDDGYVTNNAHVRDGLRWDTAKWAFSTTELANWHPLTWLSHALDYQLFGLNPAGHHDTNILLHAVNAVILFLLLQWTTGFIWRSLTVAALFALHPINVESVAWISERKNLLSMLFFLLALWAYGWYARKPGVGRYVAVAILFALGLMAKPQIITLPLVLLLWDYWPLERMFSGQLDSPAVYAGRSFPGLVLEKIPLLLISAGSGIITMTAQRAGGAVRSAMEVPFAARLENALVAYARYAGKAFWPVRLAPLYPHPGNSLAGWQVAAAGLFLLAVTAVVIAASKQRYLTVGWFWFLGTLIPMIGLVQVGEAAMADRYAYLPFLGLFLMVCWGIADWASQRRISPQRLAVPALGALAALAVVTHVQLGYWGDNVALWSHTIEITDANFVAQDNLGGALLLQGRLDEAMPHFRTAAEINPQDPLSALNIANYELQQGHLQPAIDLYNRVPRITSNANLRSNALSGLGSAYRQQGKNREAEQSYEEALQLVPQNARAWIGLGLVSQKAGDFAGAADRYSRAVEIEPTDVSYLLLAQALERAGRSAEARTAAQTAQQISSDLNAAQRETAQLLAQ